LNATALNTDITNPSHNPQNAETTTTPNRYTTPSDDTGATNLSGYTTPVHTPASATVAIRPQRSDGRGALNSTDSTRLLTRKAYN
jgi:hypothetical protein